MPRIACYMAHDPARNMEQQLDSFDEETISQLEANGIIFVAVYEDGTRQVVQASEVTEPEPQMNGVTLCTPKYVDNRTAATVAVFDALTAIVDPESAVATADETGEEAAMAADPVETFKAALAALKALGPKGETEDD